MTSPGHEVLRGDAAIIRSVNDTTRVVSLSEDRILVIRGALGETTIKVGGGELEFVSSPCRHKVCIERGRIAIRGDYIVCVPNGVSARISGEPAFDAIVP